MKTVSTLIAAIALLIGLTSPAAASAEDLLGTWQLIAPEGEEMPPDFSMRYTFGEDGVLTVTIKTPDFEQSGDGEYEVDGDTLTVTLPASLGGAEQSGTFAIEGDRMTITATADEGEGSMTILMERVEE